MCVHYWWCTEHAQLIMGTWPIYKKHFLQLILTKKTFHLIKYLLATFIFVLSFQSVLVYYGSSIGRAEILSRNWKLNPWLLIFSQRCTSHNHKRNSPKFWDTIKPFMTNKSKCCNENISIKTGKIINNPNDVCDIFNGYWTNVAREIGNEKKI